MKTKEERIIWLNNNSKFKSIEDDKIQKLANNKTISANKKILEYYRYADEILEIAKPIVNCKKGCSNCCNQRVDLSQQEVELIIKNYRKANFSKVSEKLSNLQEINKKINYTSPCPFLINNSCSIYSVRPMFCRTAMSFEPGFISCGSTIEHFYNNTKVEFAKEALVRKFGKHFEIRQIFETLKYFNLV